MNSPEPISTSGIDHVVYYIYSMNAIALLILFSSFWDNVL